MHLFVAFLSDQRSALFKLSNFMWIVLKTSETTAMDSLCHTWLLIKQSVPRLLPDIYAVYWRRLVLTLVCTSHTLSGAPVLPSTEIQRTCLQKKFVLWRIGVTPVASTNDFMINMWWNNVVDWCSTAVVTENKLIGWHLFFVSVLFIHGHVCLAGLALS